jgi:chemotaxis signal transduction protein
MPDTSPAGQQPTGFAHIQPIISFDPLFQGNISVPGMSPIELPNEGNVGCLFFDCAGQRWGVRLSDIRQVMPAQQAIPVPLSPIWLLGAFQVEMRIATMIDLDTFIGRAETKEHHLPDEQGILVAEYNNELFGLRVSHLSQAAMLDDDDLQMVPPNERHVQQPYLLAKYSPRNMPNDEASRAEGLLDIYFILARISTQLSEGDERHG